MAILDRGGEVAAPTPAASALVDARVGAVLSQIFAAYRRPANGDPNQSDVRDPHAYADFGFSIHPDQGELIYLLCRALRARRVVEFATSIGVSTLYFPSTTASARGQWVAILASPLTELPRGW